LNVGTAGVNEAASRVLNGCLDVVQSFSSAP